MRKTLLDEWNELNAKINARNEAVISEYLKKHTLPGKFYTILSYKSIVESTIKEVCINGFRVMENLGEEIPKWKPTDITQKGLKEFRDYLSNYNPEEKHICLRYETANEYGKSSGSILVSEIKPENGSSFDRALLEPILEEKKKMYEPKEGYLKCEYCGKQRLPSDIVQKRIIGRNWVKTGLRSPLFNYCKDDGCAGYAQMANEG